MKKPNYKVRNAKAKGASMEYDCQASLKQIYPDIYRTSERGFQLQYDLRTDIGKIVFECKRLKHIDWNQAHKYLLKLELVTPEGYRSALLFKSNRQPCLIMFGHSSGKHTQIQEFDKFFKVPFIKHKTFKKGSKDTFSNFQKNLGGIENDNI